MTEPNIAFIGGGQMAGALIGGLLKAGLPAASLIVVEPAEAQRERLRQQFGVATQAAADAVLAGAGLVVWAVKPQTFALAAAPCAAHVSRALQLSVMAGIRSDAIVAASGSPRVARAMPNTPALIGRGIAGLYARPAVDAGGRERVEQVLASTGATLWVDAEDDLDAVTALSGSGPAYVYYIAEAMVEAGTQMGLAPAQARRLALATFDGAAALAAASPLALAELRAQVTSKGGTTHAAITALEGSGVEQAFVRALRAAWQRARELGGASG